MISYVFYLELGGIHTIWVSWHYSSKNSSQKYIVWNFLYKYDAIKRQKTSLTSEVKQKLGTKTIYLRRINFPYMEYNGIFLTGTFSYRNMVPILHNWNNFTIALNLINLWKKTLSDKSLILYSP